MLNTKVWDEKILKLKDEYGIAGMAVAVTDRNGIVWHNAYGVTSVEKPWDPVTTQTLFRIASNTKMTLGLLVMKLVEEGKLDLDAPVKKYVPWLELHDDSTLDRITLRRLLSHSAGLPSEYTPDGPRDEDKTESILKEGLATLDPIALPEDKLYYYSNWSIRLAAYVVQSIIGKPFSVLDKEYVLKPLCMDHTMFSLTEAATYSFAVPHKKGPKVLHYIPVNAVRHPVGGLWSCVDDMTKLARVILNDGAPLVSKASMDQMKTPESDLFLNYFNSYGLTMRIKQYKDIVIYGHDGQSPPYFTSIWTVPEKGYAVCFCLNTDGGDILSTNLVPELIFDDLCELPSEWDHYEKGAYDPASEKAAAGSYIGDAVGLFQLTYEEGIPYIVLRDGKYPLISHKRTGVYWFERGGKRSCVGIPAAAGGSPRHLMLDSMLCRKVDLIEKGDIPDLGSLTGNYGTVLEHFRISQRDGRLILEKEGEDGEDALEWVFGSTFSGKHGMVSFVRSRGTVSGVRVGSSTVHNKV